MAKTAKKKKVDNTLSYEFCIKEKDVLERVHFGSFEVIKTKGGIMFKNYTGYHVFTTPYAVGYDGVAHENSLYQWLDNLIEAKKLSEGRLDEQFGDEFLDDGRPLLMRDVYDMQKITTEANMLYPLTVFTDVNRAAEQANEQIKWLTKMSEELSEAIADEASLPSEEEAVRADAETGAAVLNVETFAEMVKEIEDAEQ